MHLLMHHEVNTVQQDVGLFTAVRVETKKKKQRETDWLNDRVQPQQGNQPQWDGLDRRWRKSDLQRHILERT